MSDRLRLKIYPRQYRVMHCNSCRREFQDRETVWQFHIFAPSYVYICGECAKTLPNIPDFDPEGSKERPQINWSWLWIRMIVLERDGHKCRLDIGSESDLQERRKHWETTEVHHIIPRKDGGTDNFKNLITLCEACHGLTFKNGYGGIPSRDEAQLTLERMPSEGRFTFPTTPKIRTSEL